MVEGDLLRGTVVERDSFFGGSCSGGRLLGERAVFEGSSCCG